MLEATDFQKSSRSSSGLDWPLVASQYIPSCLSSFRTGNSETVPVAAARAFLREHRASQTLRLKRTERHRGPGCAIRKVVNIGARGCLCSRRASVATRYDPSQPADIPEHSGRSASSHDI